ncbi:MAG: hypothetical protein CNE97_01725 [alpha proteobacterium MED-G10]|nr:hypothetical protein [Rickettsiales bacterium]PDH56248.1 MAG: hypothetical protein CNE97_01725 [alpha proteobacterium MED-G10]|tara:strand:- start:600 stop:911 length:312 start_codon:yes stop_codon:yes gene_type:complete
MKSPDALKTIGEVSDLLNVPIYVLRFWEKKISIIAPIKKNNGIRFYDTEQIDLLKTLRRLLYEKKFSIEGAKNQLLVEKKINKERKQLILDLKQLIIEMNELI